MRFLPLVFLIVSACEGHSRPATSKPAPATQSARASSSASAPPIVLPIAQFLGHDNATGSRVFELLRAAGINASAGGSLGYSVWVDGVDRDQARRILVSAAQSECLQVAIFDDRGAPLTGTQPARCALPTASPPLVNSRK